MEYLKTHLYWLVIVVILGLAARSWLIEHDNRLLTVQQMKISEERIKDSAQQVQTLQEQIKTTEASKDAQLAAMRRQIAQVSTPAQAQPVIQQLAPQLNSSQPSGSTVTVEAVPLAQTLAQCRQDSIELGSCKQNFAVEVKIVEQKDEQLAQKDVEIKTLKKPQGFWKRLKSSLKVFGIGVGAGIALGGHL